MKTLIMALKLFKKHIFLNVLIIIELAAVTAVAVVASDMSRASTACITTLQNSCDHIIYYVNDTNLSDDNSGTFDERVKKINEKRNTFETDINKAVKDFSFVKGYSTFKTSFMVFDANGFSNGKIKRDACSDIITEDDETVKAVRYPLEKGKWFSSSKAGDCVPCVIGGVYSARYSVGQKIKGYTYADGIGTGKSLRKIDFIITGILAKPEQLLDTIYTTNDRSLSASAVFQSKLDDPLLIIAATSAVGKMMSTSISADNEYIYLDRSATPAQISALRTKLTRDFTFTDGQLIDNEKKQLAQSLSIIMPFIIMLLLVSFCGVVSMCMLTTLKNMETFKIYFVTGCPRYKTVVITGIYSLFYFVVAAVVFFIFMKLLQNSTADLMTKANFIVYPFTLLLIGACIAAVCLLSFIIPFFILRRQRPADLIRTN